MDPERSICQISPRYWSGPFKSEYALHKAYDALDYKPRSAVKMPDLRIFPILDVDRHRDLFPSYRTKDIFRDSVRHIAINSRPKRRSISPDE